MPAAAPPFLEWRRATLQSEPGGRAHDQTASGSITRVWQPDPIIDQDASEQPPSEPADFARRAARVGLMFDDQELDRALEAATSVATRQALDTEEIARGARLGRTLEAIEEALPGLARDREILLDQMSRDLVTCFTQAMDRLRPDLERGILATALAEIVQNELQKLADAECIDMRVAADDAELVREKLDPVIASARLNVPLTIIADTELEPGTADLNWRHGNASCDARARVEHIRSTLVNWLTASETGEPDEAAAVRMARTSREGTDGPNDGTQPEGEANHE